MLIKNVSQVCKFPLFSLIGQSLPQELTALLGGNDKEAIDAATTPEVVTMLEAFDATSVMDLADIETTLGMFLFDCYLAGVVTPSTPMGNHIATKRAQELAATFEKDEFDLPDYAVKGIRNTLTDDALWNKISVTAFSRSKDGETKRFLTLSARGISAFHQVLSAATEALYDPELDVAQ